jgi:hypothetical protein
MVRLWSPKVGSDAAELMWRAARGRIVVVAGSFGYAGPWFGLNDAFDLALLELLLPVTYMIVSLVDLQRFYARATQVLGVDIGWGAGIPNDEPGYLSWCRDHKLTPNPFSCAE